MATENRGKGSIRKNKIPDETWQMIKEHWNSFPSKKSHYGRKKSERKFFDNPELNITILYSLFKEHYKEKTGQDLSMKYSTYQKFFSKNSEYSFRAPKTDVCDFCAKCLVKLQINPNDECKVAYDDHLKKVKEYNELKKKYVFKNQEKESAAHASIYDDTLVLEFDYAQNLTLPKLNINSHYYKRILNLYVFNIHCYNDNDSKMFCFLESDGKKDSNSVCSFLEDFVSKKLAENSNYKKVVFFSDSAGGQNKNLTVVKFCSWFSKKYNIEITHLYPVRGHSYCQCDRNFGTYGAILKKKEKVESPEEYLNIMRTARKNVKPFEAELSGDLLKDWTKGLGIMYKKTPKLKKHQFSIQKYVKIQYKPSSEVLTYYGYNSESIKFDNSCKGKVNLELLPISKPGITEDKKKDLQFFIPYLQSENKNWLQAVTMMNEKDSQLDEVMSDEESEFED